MGNHIDARIVIVGKRLNEVNEENEEEEPMLTNPTHPGESIRYDCMEPLGLSVTETARRLGVSRKHLSAILNGRAGISPEMAVRLDKVFGGDARTWYAVQVNYDVAQVLARADEIIVPDLEPATT